MRQRKVFMLDVADVVMRVAAADLVVLCSLIYRQVLHRKASGV